MDTGGIAKDISLSSGIGVRIGGADHLLPSMILTGDDDLSGDRPNVKTSANYLGFALGVGPVRIAGNKGELDYRWLVPTRSEYRGNTSDSAYGILQSHSYFPR